MVDELLNISIIGHLVMFVTIIKDDLYVFFLGWLEIKDKINNFIIIFYYLINYLKNWKIDLYKFVAFGSDDVSTMVDSHGVVANMYL